MPVERRNPLPPGTYWVDVPPPTSRWNEFRAWLSRHKQSVTVLKQRAIQPGWDETFDSAKAVMWVLFKVHRPVPWEGPGLPTIAEQADATEPADTLQRPPVQDTSFALGGGVGLLFLLWLLMKR